MSENKYALPAGTLLDGKYQIESVLGVGGFGIVYKARHQLLGSFVAIKEYLPLEFALRDGEQIIAASRSLDEDYQQGLQRFVDEAKQLVRFNAHPNIVGCHDFFEAKGTAYLVMNFEEGEPLSELIKRREQTGSPMTQDELLDLLLPLLFGLEYIHRHDVLHRDIKPDNIFIRRSDGQPVLLDFGAAKQAFSRYSKSMAAFTPGYAAPEQIDEDGELGPWTDIYAVGALIWRVMYCAVPPKAEMRLSATVRGKPDPAHAPDKPGASFSPSMVKLVQDCMALEQNLRPQSVVVLAKTWQSLRATPAQEAASALSAGGSASALKKPEPEQTPAASKSEERNYLPLRIGLAAALIVVGVVIVMLLLPAVADRTSTLDAHIDQSLLPSAGTASTGDTAKVPATRDCEQLSIERNRLFKRHGYCFQSARMIELLGNEGCDQSDSALVFNTRFSDAERQAVQTIRAQEQRLACL